MTQVDTPDYQRGVVSAQKLLGANVAGQTLLSVGVPPNLETLVVVAEANVLDAYPTAVGLGTGIKYPGTVLQLVRNTGPALAWVFDVPGALDDTINVQWVGSPSGNWFVYSDANAHGVVDLGNKRDQAGTLYTVPVVPGAGAASHPPQELLMASNVLGGAGVVVNNAPTGKRYRVFSGTMSAAAAGMIGYLLESVSSFAFAGCAGVGNNALYLPPQGLALPATAAINYSLFAGAGNMLITLQYTLETV